MSVKKLSGLFIASNLIVGCADDAAIDAQRPADEHTVVITNIDPMGYSSKLDLTFESASEGVEGQCQGALIYNGYFKTYSTQKQMNQDIRNLIEAKANADQFVLDKQSGRVLLKDQSVAVKCDFEM